MNMSWNDIKESYEKNKSAMELAYSYGYRNKRTFIEAVINSEFDADAFLVLSVLLNEMWFRLPDSIFNIMNEKARPFFDFLEDIETFGEEKYMEKIKNENS